MNILERLSSVSGEKPSIANNAVAKLCIENSLIIEEIADNISNKNFKIAADCAEVMTMIAEEKPELITSYPHILFNHLNHKKSNVRWECAHALSLAAHLIGDIISENLDKIMDIIENDNSIVVRDYAIDIFVGFATIGILESKTVYSYLKEALKAHNSRHAGHAIDGFTNIASKTDLFDDAILKLIEPYKLAQKKVIANKANKLSKLILSK